MVTRSGGSCVRFLEDGAAARLERRSTPPHDRALIGQPQPTAWPRASIAGLAKCGGQKDVLLLAPFLRCAQQRIRVAALVGTARLDGESLTPFVEALADPVRLVSAMGGARARPALAAGAGQAAAGGGAGARA
jgi:hypothetical protein